MISKLIIIGTGLIGGSLALALKAAGEVGQVVGIDRSPEHAAEAVRLGVIDGAGDYDRTTLADAELVVVATPVAQMPSVFERLAGLFGPETVVTDAGSTKRDVVAAAERIFGDALARFVPGHPIAGTEHSGPAAAFPGLYRDRNVVLTPLPQNPPAAVAKVAAVWAATGARVHRMEPRRHDEIFAAVSHLPHLLAFALVDELAGRADGQEYLRFAAGGFRDFTRIASSSPEMWRDICLANHDMLRGELDRFRAKLDVLDQALVDGDRGALEAAFTTARDTRNAWLAQMNNGGTPPRK